MRIKDNSNLLMLLNQVKLCEGEVCFVTDDGDKLNLKSALSQYIFVAMAGKPELLESGKIDCENAADLDLLKDYLQIN